MKEIWKDIKGYEGIYQVSNLGRIKSLEREIPWNRWPGFRVILNEKILKPGLCRGYSRVTLSKNKQKNEFQVHRLVLEAFVEPCQDGLEANHKNFDRSDNRVENLEWVTRSENIKHSFRYGRNNQKGSKNGYAKLEEKDVLKIREFGKGVKQRILAEMFSVTQCHISDIINRKIWTHI